MIPADDRTPVSEWEPTTLEDVYNLLSNLRPWWHQYAACRGMAAEHHEDGNVFFPERGQHKGENQYKAENEARRICATCPVEPECLEFGLTQHDGIWGRTSARQRKAIRSQRNAHIRPERCGTEAGYQKHVRAGNPACAACLTAHRAMSRKWRERTA